MGGERRGAYGFRLVLEGAEEPLPHLVEVSDSAPTVAIERLHASSVVDRSILTADVVAACEPRGPRLEVFRDPPSIVIGQTEPITDEALVHPLLTVPISILARWRGDLTLHAGAFFARGRAWGVVGTREAGKSTTLAKLAERGVPLLADDLLVLDDGEVRAGPACVDLRPDVAARTPAAISLGEVAGRHRFRLPAAEGPPRGRLAGFFVLDWSEEELVEVEPIPTAEALQVVYDQEYMGLLGDPDPRRIVEVIGVPMWRVRRPRDWARTDEAIDGILAATASEALA